MKDNQATIGRPGRPDGALAHQTAPEHQVSVGTLTSPDKGAVTRELNLILGSSPFHSSKRSQQFLTFVVQHELAGGKEPLKERTIGTELFNRPPNYATGDDSVVRVQAGEVRRRLEQYYQAPPSDSFVRIELPVGSYTPEFHWSAASSLTSPRELTDEGGEVSQAPQVVREVTPPTASHAEPAGTRKWGARTLILALSLLVAALGLGIWEQRARSPEFALKQFWSPIFVTSKPLLICLPKPIFYRPSIDLYKRRENSPREFDNEVDRMNSRPHLQPDEKLAWGDMVEFSDFGVSKGDVKAGFQLSTLITKLGKDSEVRVGNDYAWDDLLNSPAILIGAFSNPWAMKVTSGLHFTFAENRGVFWIQEQNSPGRSWYDELDKNSQVAFDYGLVTRLVSSSTGQFLVSVAGITAPGSEAAAKVVSTPQDLAKALDKVPAGWQTKNMQIVVKTSVTDGIAGPPQIVAVYVW